MMMKMPTQLTDFSTQAARAAELRRRKLRRSLLAQWTATRAAIDAEKAAAVKAINRDELNAAKDEAWQ
jgi:hypothetical protein